MYAQNWTKLGSQKYQSSLDKTRLDAHNLYICNSIDNMHPSIKSNKCKYWKNLNSSLNWDILKNKEENGNET